MFLIANEADPNEMPQIVRENSLLGVPRPPDKECIFLFLYQNICDGYLKEPSLHEMVLLSTQNTRFNWWVIFFYNFMLKQFGLMFVPTNIFCSWLNLDT